MGALDDLGQTVKGKAQQIKGDFEQQSGQGLKGGISKIKGMTNEELGKLKLKNKQRRADNRRDNI